MSLKEQDGDPNGMESGMIRRRPKSEKRLMKRTSTTYKRTDILEAAKNDDIEEIQRALRNGDDINKQDENGNTALHEATMFNLYGVISYLIYMGADPSTRNKEGVAVADICRNIDIRNFLGQVRRMILQEDYRKVEEEVLCLTYDDTEGIFKSSHVTVDCPSLTEGDTLTLRCRSVRLAWRFLDVSEAACSDSFIICTDKSKSIEETGIEIPLYNLPSASEEICIKTNPETDIKDITTYERKRVSFCKFKTSLPPVLSIVAVCRHKIEVFDVSSETKHLISETDRRVVVEIPENTVITPGELKLQVYNNTEYESLLKMFSKDVVTPVLNLRPERLETSGEVSITLPLFDNVDTQKDIVVASLTENTSDICLLTCVMNNDSKSITVSHSPKGIVAGLVKIEPFTKADQIKDILQSVLDKTNGVKFQIGSKQRRDQQKKCKVIVTCSPEEEVDTTVEFWERDGFHFQWCTETYKSSSGETFSITLSGSTVFSNGLKEERIQFHPRRKNYVILEVISNDVLSNVSLSNVDIRPAYSKLNPGTSLTVPLKKAVYIRKTNTGILEDMSKDNKNYAELEREVSNISDKTSSYKKKKKVTLLRRISRENTKEMKSENKNGILIENNYNESKVNEHIDDLDKTTGSKQKEATNISSESLQVSLTSLDVEESIRSTRTEKGKGNKLTSVFLIDSNTNSVLKEGSVVLKEGSVVLKEGSVVTSERPVTVRSIVIENLAAFLPVEKTFFSDAYLAVLLDEISENWLVIFVLIGIPFDVIDVRMTELYGKSPLHDVLLQLLKSWRDESSFHIHKGVPLLLSALRKGGKWDLSISVQQRLKIWHDQGIASEDPLYKWLKKAYTESDILIPAEYPRPMSDAFLVMFAPDVQVSLHVTTALSLSYEEFNSVQDNCAYTNDTVKIMKILTSYRSKKTDVLCMLEGLMSMCNHLDLKRASQCIVVSLKGWLKRSAGEDEPLKVGIERLLSKLTQPNHKSSTTDSILHQRLDVRAALRVLQTPKHKNRRQARSEYGKPSTSS